MTAITLRIRISNMNAYNGYSFSNTVSIENCQSTQYHQQIISHVPLLHDMVVNLKINVVDNSL